MDRKSVTDEQTGKHTHKKNTERKKDTYRKTEINFRMNMLCTHYIFA